MAVQTEFEGKNVDEALEAASKELKIAVDKINYDVLHYGNNGIFGFIGVKKARIKIKTRSDNSNRDESRVSSLVDEAFSSESSKGLLKSKPKAKKPVKKAASFEKKEKPAAADIKPKEKKSVEKEQKSLAPVNDREEKKYNDSYESDTETVIDVSEEAVEKGRETLERILPLLVESFEITPEISGNEVLYNLKADNPGVIIGKKGQNLESIQFLVDKIVNKVSEGRVRVLIDIEDYLERRRQNLQSLAVRFAEKVKKSGKPATIGQLSAYERRFIHIALREDRRVRTQSMGEGYYRKLVVFPSRKTRGKRRPPKRK